MSRRHAVLFLVILITALVVRAVFAGWVVGWHSIGRGDEAEYHEIARNIADGKGFAGMSGEPTGRRAPIYPAMLSVLYNAVGPNKAVARLVQVLMGVLIVALIYLLGRRYFGENVGLLAAALSALNPFLMFVSGYMLSENLFVVVILSALLCLPTPSAFGASLRRLIAAAVILAVAALTRPTAVALTIWIFAASLLLSQLPWKTRLIRLGVVVAVCFVITMPWMIRNARLFNAWVGITTYSGVIFFQGNNPKTLDIPHYRGGVAPIPALPRYQDLIKLDEHARSKFAFKMGRQFLRHNWRAIPKMAWWKFERFWRLKSDVGLSGIRSGWWFDNSTFLGALAARFDAGFIYAIVVFPLFVAGIVLTRGRWRDLVFLYGVVVVHTAIAVVFFGSIRQRVPVEPVIAILAAAALVTIVRRYRGPRGGNTPARGRDPAAP